MPKTLLEELFEKRRDPEAYRAWMNQLAAELSKKFWDKPQNQELKKRIDLNKINQ